MITSTKVEVWLVETGTTLAREKPQHTGSRRNSGRVGTTRSIADRPEIVSISHMQNRAATSYQGKR